ncbi:MAG: DAK2 domain-containing protein [Acidimicrobiia bacterium]
MGDTGTLTELDGAALARVVATYRDALRSHQEELNRLNVYPVPDGDTGTNMALTIESVCTEVGNRTRMDDVCKAMAHGSLMGARGNSGVILSQILRGLSEVFATLPAVTAEHLTAGLRQAADAAYQAVMRPVEGTILTVVRTSAEAAEAARDDGAKALSGLLERVTAAAHDAVARTPDLLPVLKEAGVVDAGGHGFALMLDAFLHIVDGRPLPEPQIVTKPAAIAAHERGVDVSSLRYEVMFLLEADEATIPALKETWSGLGDSIVVTGGDGLWSCHVHTDEIGAAIEASIEAGRPSKIRVTDLIDQVEEEQWVREARAQEPLGEAVEPVTTAVVAVAVGEGLQRLLRSVGVHEVVAGGQSMNPSTAQILEAVDRARADAVVVLPNNKNIVAVAQQVDDLTQRSVAVVPTHAVVEALAALVAYDPDAPLKDNISAMTDAAERVQAGEITQAVRDSVAECGPIAEGDWIALTRDGIQLTAASAFDAAVGLLERLVNEESELITVLVGADARSADTTRLREHVGLEHPHVELEVHAGDQPLYPYLIGVE